MRFLWKVWSSQYAPYLTLSRQQIVCSKLEFPILPHHSPPSPKALPLRTFNLISTLFYQLSEITSSHQLGELIVVHMHWPAFLLPLAVIMGDLISLFLKFIRFGRGRHPLLPTYKMGTSDCQKGDPRMGHDYDHDQSQEHQGNILEQTCEALWNWRDLWKYLKHLNNDNLSDLTINYHCALLPHAMRI